MATKGHATNGRFSIPVCLSDQPGLGNATVSATVNLATRDTPPEQWQGDFPKNLTLRAGECDDFPVALAPDSVGEKSATLTLNCDGSGHNCDTAFAVSGRGVQASALLSGVSSLGTLTRSRTATQLLVDSSASLVVGDLESVDIYGTGQTAPQGKKLRTVAFDPPLNPATRLCPLPGNNYLPHQEKRFRLVSGGCPSSNSTISGRLEVQNIDKSWGTVCDDGFDSIDAQVACRSVGLQREGAAFQSKNMGCTTVTAPVPIYLENLACTGTERTLLECPSAGLGSHDCTHDEDVHITCSNFLNEPVLNIRQPPEPNRITGRLALQRAGDSSSISICGDGFDDNAARIACRDLGSTLGPVSYSSMNSTNTGGDSTFVNIACAGTEERLIQCSRTEGQACHSGELELSCPKRAGCSAPDAGLQLLPDGLYSYDSLGENRMRIQESLVLPDAPVSWCAPLSTTLFTSDDTGTRLWTRTDNNAQFVNTASITVDGLELTELTLVAQPMSQTSFGLTTRGEPRLFVFDASGTGVTTRELPLPADDISMMVASTDGRLFLSNGTSIHIINARAWTSIQLSPDATTSPDTSTAPNATTSPTIPMVTFTIQYDGDDSATLKAALGTLVPILGVSTLATTAVLTAVLIVKYRKSGKTLSGTIELKTIKTDKGGAAS